MNKLFIATQSTGSGSQSVGIYSQGGRVDLNNVFMSISSTTDAAFGILTDSDTSIVDSEFHHAGDDGSPVRATNGRITIEESTIKANGSGSFQSIAVHSTGAALLLARNEIEAGNATRATAIKMDGSFIEDRRSRLDASGSDYSRAIHASNCSTAGVSLIGTDLNSDAAASFTDGFYADACVDADASAINSVAKGANGNAIRLSQTPLSVSDSRLEGGDNATGFTYNPSDTNSYSIHVVHSRLIAPDLLFEAGPYDDTAVAHSQLDGSVGAGVSCVSNVDGDLNDLGNTCP